VTALILFTAGIILEIILFTAGMMLAILDQR